MTQGRLQRYLACKVSTEVTIAQPQSHNLQNIFFSFFTCGSIEHTADVATELLGDAAVVVVGPLVPGVTETRGSVVGQAVPGVPDAVESVEAVGGHVARPGHPVQREPFLGTVGEHRLFLGRITTPEEQEAPARHALGVDREEPLADELRSSGVAHEPDPIHGGTALGDHVVERLPQVADLAVLILQPPDSVVSGRSHRDHVVPASARRLDDSPDAGQASAGPLVPALVPLTVEGLPVAVEVDDQSDRHVRGRVEDAVGGLALGIGVGERSRNRQVC